MASTRGITVQAYFQDRYVDGVTEGFRWRIEVLEARDMPTAIFLHCKVATAFYAPETGGAEPPEAIAWAGEFNGVASAADLEEYPEGEPRDDQFPPFYRLPYLDQAFRSKHLGMSAYGDVRNQVRVLVETLDIMDDIRPVPPETFGAPLPMA